jgi:hypothetical protein
MPIQDGIGYWPKGCRNLAVRQVAAVWGYSGRDGDASGRQPVVWARQMPLGADRLSRDYRSQVRNEVLGFSLSHRRG